MSQTASPSPRGRVEVPCARCGISFPTWASRLKIGSGRYCSRTCMKRGRDGRIHLAERFWRYVDRTADPLSCWVWTGTKNRTGYGRLRLGPAFGRHSELAPRLAVEIASGQDIPDGLFACHTCDTPACVRNDDIGTYVVNGIAYPRFGHLWLGTSADNTADRHQKLRDASGDRNGLRLHPDRVTRGSRSPHARLTEAAVQDIRRRYLTGERDRKALRDEFAVSMATIARIVRGNSWRHVSVQAVPA